jgi:hypothetical protein
MRYEAGFYLRMAAGLARYQLSQRQTDPVGAIREQMLVREARFLDLIRPLLAQRDHVYRKLCDLAGCTYDDIERDVQQRGLRATLNRLFDAGVYITHEEFTKRCEMVRGGLHIQWNPRELDNAAGRGFNMQRTSGSTGRPVTTAVSNAYLLYREGHETLQVQMASLRDRARVIVGATLPSIWPIRRQVTWARLGVPIDRWFTMGAADWWYRWLTDAMVAQIRILGARARMPELLPENDFTPVARALAQLRDEGRPAFVRTMVSMATRVASAARERRLDISGTMFSVAGETLTPSKRAVMEATGATVITDYGATEFGVIGAGCPTKREDDSIHLCDDVLIVVSRSVPGRDHESLFISNQLACGPRILINVGIDDCGIIEPGRCDCEYQRLGFTMRARQIASYGKVTAQGMTMDAADLVELIEATLPARFGGAPGDYQLAEIDGPVQSEIRLRISPRVRVSDQSAIREFVLGCLGTARGGSLAERVWRFSDTMTVVIEEPEPTAAGKVLPLRLGRK